MLENQDKRMLLEVAASSIRHGLEHGTQLAVHPGDFSPALQEQRACFVTLKIHDELRGCIGSLAAWQPLVSDVAHNAYAAAFQDPRFPPLTDAEYPSLHYHISILTPATPMQFASEQDLVRQLRPGIDGLVLEDQGRRGTFLPSVWESLPEPADFMHHLKLKASLPADHWSDTLRVSRYTVEDIEPETLAQA